MLVPFLVLCPVALLLTFVAASHMADSAFDHELAKEVAAISKEISRPGSPEEMAARVRERVNPFPYDPIVVQVSEVGGAVIVADAALPPFAPSDPRDPGAIRYREALLGGEHMRIAYEIVPASDARPTMIVQVGESTKRRRDLAGGVTGVAIGVIFCLLAATLVLVWTGLRRGLAPLETLRGHVDGRDPDDLSPIPSEGVPGEIAPLMTALNRQLERVRRNLDAQRRFVADAAHQMRTPIAGLKTQAQAALRGGTLADAHQRLMQIEESADRLGRLMTQLLALARADDARLQPVSRENVDLNGVLREVCAQWADRALAKPVQLDFDAAEAPAHVEGSALLLRELFANLLDNAIRYTPEGGDILVRVESQPSPRVIVEDTGIGIAPSDRELVFEPFYRVLGTGESGSGLGLPIVKTIANLHGATIAIEDRGEVPGTRFRIVFA